MSNNNEFNKFRQQIASQIEEFEEKIKVNVKSEYSNLKSFETVLLQDFIENHYNEMLHHLGQIKYHLEKVNQHQKELEVGELYLAHAFENDGGDSNLRQKEDRIRFKNRRMVKTTSLKYVLLWEKMLDQQKEENVWGTINKRARNENGLNHLKADEVSKIMVKSRVLQFEGRHKPRRVSSTFEKYLDCIAEKPTRAQSFPSLDEIDEEENCETERPRSCDITYKLDNTNDSAGTYIQNRENKDIINTEQPKVDENVTAWNENEMLPENDLRKPKIIEVHLKQQ